MNVLRTLIVMPTTYALYDDQTLSKEGSTVLIITRIPWDASPELRTKKVVESIKMIVVIPNKNMDPGE
jgi:hypothetical protein